MQICPYYLRAVEVPSLRWSWQQCVNLPGNERPPECANDAPKVIQQLAWTSPIWYLPEENKWGRTELPPLYNASRKPRSLARIVTELPPRLVTRKKLAG